MKEKKKGTIIGWIAIAIIAFMIIQEIFVMNKRYHENYDEAKNEYVHQKQDNSISEEKK